MRKLIYLFIILVSCFSLFAEMNEEAKEMSLKMDSLEGEEKIDLYIELINFQKTIDTSIAVKIAEEAYQYAQYIGDEKAIIKIQLELGELYREMGAYIRAYELFTEVREITDKTEYQKEYISSLINLARLNQNISAGDKSVDLLFKALDLSYAFDEKHLIATILLEIGTYYKKQHERQLAILYLTSARDKFDELKDYQFKTRCSILIGKTYLDQKDFDLAKVTAESVVRDAQSYDLPWFEALAFNDLAWINLNLEKFEEALAYNKKAQVIREKNNFFASKSSIVNSGEVYLRWGKYEKAGEVFSNIYNKLETDNTFNGLVLKKRLINLMIELATAQGDFKKAFNNKLVLDNIQNDIDDITNTDAISNLRILFEIERKDNLRITEIKIKESEIEKKQIAIYALLLLIVLGGSLGVLLLSRYKLRKKIAEDLERRNKNLSELNSKLNNEIEDRKKLEKQISAQKDHLHLINKILRHDLANDIATINSGISIYRRTKNDDIFEEISARINKSIQLITNMKKFESFMSTHSMLRPIEVKLILDDLESNYKGLEFGPMEKCEVLADDSLSSVLENIIGNAVSHGGADKIKITCVKESDKIYIHIDNNGSPIPNLISDRIFDEGFKYGDNANTGMGLHIVKKLMDSYGGSVVALNLPEGGVRFTLQFYASI